MESLKVDTRKFHGSWEKRNRRAAPRCVQPLGAAAQGRRRGDTGAVQGRGRAAGGSRLERLKAQFGKKLRTRGLETELGAQYRRHTQ